MIYFDNAATTKIDKRVIDKMAYVLENIYGNASGKYYSEALSAAKEIREARERVAEFIGANKEEIIFNSGASEGNNHVIKGIAIENKVGNIITTMTEHNSTLKACLDLKETGYDITILDVDKYGVISVEELESKIKENTVLVSVIWANNEIGSKNHIKKIVEICHKKGVMVHVDATQIIGKEIIKVTEYDLDFLTFSAHKIYGPKGVGVLYVKRDKYGLFPEFKALISGSQEEENRGGTYCNHNIAGLGEAVKILMVEVENNIKNLYSLENYLINNMDKSKIILNGYDIENKVPGIVNIQIPNVNNEILIKEISDRVALSTGSACSLNNPSHVLAAIGLDKFQIRNSIRISFGKYNTKEEVDIFLEILKKYI